MTLSGTEVRFGCLATADPTAVNVSGSQSIGTSAQALVYTDVPTVAYSLGMLIQSGDTLTMNLYTGAVTGTVAGTNQVETATIVAASGATTAGNLNVTVTSALVTGSPLLVPVALLLTDNTASLVATKVRAALTATAAIAAHYTVGGTGANYSLTAIEKAANDSTLNLAHANGTCTGITTATTSTNTTAGVGTTRAYKFTGVTWDATDYEGRALPSAMNNLHSILIRSASTSGSVEVSAGTYGFNASAPFVSLQSSPAGAHELSGNSVTFTAATQEVARVELVDRCLRHVFHAGLKAGNGVTAAFCMWVIAREQIEVIV